MTKVKKDKVVHARKATNPKTDIVVQARALCNEQGLSLADACGRHNDRVIPDFKNGGRYDKHGKLVPKRSKGGLTPNVCVEGNKSLLKKRTERVIGTLMAWVDEGIYTKAQMKTICAGSPHKFDAKVLKEAGLA